MLAQEVALLKFRVGTAEDDMRRLNDVVRVQSQRK
jgi:hypothetical protein